MGWVVESPGTLAPHVVEDGMDWGILFWALVQSLPQDRLQGQRAAHQALCLWNRFPCFKEASRTSLINFAFQSI